MDILNTTSKPRSVESRIQKRRMLVSKGNSTEDLVFGFDSDQVKCSDPEVSTDPIVQSIKISVEYFSDLRR